MIRWPLVLLTKDTAVEKLLLKPDSLQDLSVPENQTFRDDHELVVVIVKAVNDGHSAPGASSYRFIHSEQVGVQGFAVGCERTGNESIIHFVQKIVAQMF